MNSCLIIKVYAGLGVFTSHFSTVRNRFIHIFNRRGTPPKLGSSTPLSPQMELLHTGIRQYFPKDHLGGFVAYVDDDDDATQKRSRPIINS
jgi:hypothetical protein